MSERECGCPSGVKWCAHFDGQIVIICGPSGQLHNHGNAWIDTSFSVRTTRGFESCQTGCPAIIIEGDDTDSLFLDEDAARAEFERRRELLRVGDQAGLAGPARVVMGIGETG